MSSITAGICTDGKYLDSLALTLSALLTGSQSPQRIIVQFNDPQGRTDSFVLSQLAHLALLKNVPLDFVFEPAHPHGIRGYRDVLIRRVSSGGLLFVDDDVLLDGSALTNLTVALRSIDEADCGWVCGTKLDVNNLRGYADYSREWSDSPVKDTHTLSRSLEPVSSWVPDTGFMLLNVPLIIKNGIKFVTNSIHANSGGEDTIFGAQCGSKGLEGYIIPSARAWHLDKAQIRFTQDAARTEAVMRTLDSLNIAYPELPLSWTVNH